MDDISKAISIESKYVYNVQNKIENDVGLLAQLNEVGFDTLDDFFNAKKEYLMQQVLKDKVHNTSSGDAMKTLGVLAENMDWGIVSVDTDETCVHAGSYKESNLNEDYCLKNNIPIYKYDSYGGNIVASVGDYSMGFIVPSDIDIDCRYVIEKLADIVSKYIDGVTIDGNDVLIDGKKVIGTTSKRTADFFFFICHISMSDKKEIIYNICGAPKTNKEVGYINPNKVSVDTLKEEMLTWLQGL